LGKSATSFQYHFFLSYNERDYLRLLLKNNPSHISITFTLPLDSTAERKSFLEVTRLIPSNAENKISIPAATQNRFEFETYRSTLD
jgi:hypothetical protein